MPYAISETRDAEARHPPANQSVCANNEASVEEVFPHCSRNRIFWPREVHGMGVGNLDALVAIW